MREQTGLDALATLCGGVANATSSQVLKNEIQRQQSQAAQQKQSNTMHHSAILNTQHPVAAASNPMLESNNGAAPAPQPAQNQQQLWYQAFMNAAAYGGLNPLLSQFGSANLPTAMSSLHQHQPNANAGVDPNSLSAVQQLAFLSAYQAAAAAQNNASLAATAGNNDILNNAPNFMDRNLAAMMIARAQQQQSYQMNNVEANDRVPAPAPNKSPPMLSTPLTVPSPPTKTTSPKISPAPFPKPQERERRPSDTTPTTEKRSYQRTKPAPKRKPSPTPPTEDLNHEDEEEPEGKKLQKRAANRRSAQLSRKRKKQFIEELKEENDDLRRKEQILSSIPDLVVAFALCGKILFISNSVETFLGFKPDELENSCFWDRLCVDSIRLLKAAFMDALVAKKPGMDVTPLGEGLWEVRLVDKEGTPRLVSLNGVVHFSSDNPECVCSIRPIAIPPRNVKYARQKSSKISFSSNEEKEVKPQQSVLNTLSGDDASSVVMLNGRSASQQGRNGRGPLQVSDGDSFISESNSDE